jgi:CrcB protein
MTTEPMLAEHLPLDGDAEQLPSVPGTPTARGRLKSLVLEFALILGGGVVGTLARVLISLTLGPAVDHGFPWDIALINVSGAFLIGLLAGWRDPASRAHELIWLAGAVGFLGAFTTFSSFALGIVTLTVSGKTLLGLLYLSGSVLAGLLAVESGLWLGRKGQTA